MSKSLRFLISSMFSTTKISYVSKHVFLIEMFLRQSFVNVLSKTEGNKRSTMTNNVSKEILWKGFTIDSPLKM